MFGLVGYRTLTQLRQSWRSLALIAVLAGLFFGAAIAAAAAARRTSSAYERFTQANDGWDALYVNNVADGTALLRAEDVQRLPDVELVHEVRYDYAQLGPGTAFVADPSGRLGVEVSRARMLEGRWMRADAADEVVLSFALAEREGLSVGDTFEIFAPDDLAQVTAPEERAFVDALLAAAPGAVMRVVGIAAIPGQFPPIVNPGIPLLHLSPAFARLPEASPNSALLVRLRAGADIDAFAEAAGRLADEQGAPSALVLHRELSDDVARSLRPQIVALAILALALACAAMVITAQAVARQVEADLTSSSTLRALGLRTADLMRITAAQWTVVGAAAAAVAALTAIALSPLSPSGLARLAEPSPGVRVDGLALIVGATLSALVVLTAGVAKMVLRGRTPHSAHPRLRGGLGLPVPGQIGLWRAFDRGDRLGPVPVWSTIGAATVGIVALAGSLTFGATLSHQLDDPVRYGLRWDLEVTQFTESSFATEGARLLADDARLAGVATGVTGRVPMGDREESVMAMDPVRGEVRPPVLRGFYPAAADAVALGSRTRDRLGTDIGGRVQLDFGEVGGTNLDFTVVGEVLMPPLGTGGHIGDGILLSPAGLRRALGDDDDGPASLYLAAAPGTDLHAVIDELTERIDPEERPSLSRPTTPADLVDLGRARSMPTLLAAAMALAAIAGLVHTLLRSGTRRRHDTAVLRVLGFRSGQLYSIALVQAVAIAVASLVIGVPTGILVGGLAWNALADSIGSPLRAQVPVLLTVAALPAGAVVMASLASLIAGWRAARLRPSDVLRDE